MSRQRRVLIVDNLEQWRDELVEILQRQDYYAESALTVADTLKQLKEHFYHVLIADIRMNETDQGNTDGMDLLSQLEESRLSEATKVIILSAFGTPEQMREAFTNRRVADFLAKDNFLREPFLTSVERVFSRDVMINLALEILYQAGTSSEEAVLDLEIDGTRIQRNMPMQKQLAVEWEDLLCRLFYQTDGILVRPLTAGQSGTGVLRIEPFYRNKGIGREVIVKYGAVSKIQQEYQNFKEYVEPFVGGGRNTDVLGVRYSTHLGGVVYTFLGTSNDRLGDFAEFYRRSDMTDIALALDQLFQDTCGTWYANRKRELLDLKGDYQRLFGYTPQRLDQIRARQLRSVRGKQRLRFTSLKSERTFSNPLLVIDRASFAFDTYTCTTHGDFNPHNLLVDNAGHIWLIDFQGTGPGHILRDVAMLDSAIRFQILAENAASLEERLYMEEFLLDSLQNFSQVEQMSSSIPTENQALAKAYAVVVHLRRQAYRLVAQNQDSRLSEYYIALFFSALNTLQFFSLSSTQREHALLSASLLADRLDLSSR